MKNVVGCYLPNYIFGYTASLPFDILLSSLSLYPPSSHFLDHVKTQHNQEKKRLKFTYRKLKSTMVSLISLTGILVAVTTVTSVMAIIVPPVPNPYKTSLGQLTFDQGGLDFYSNCWSAKDCEWVQAKDNNKKDIPGARQCTCNNNPDNWR